MAAIQRERESFTWLRIVAFAVNCIARESRAAAAAPAVQRAGRARWLLPLGIERALSRASGMQPRACSPIGTSPAQTIALLHETEIVLCVLFSKFPFRGRKVKKKQHEIYRSTVYCKNSARAISTSNFRQNGAYSLWKTVRQVTAWTFDEYCGNFYCSTGNAQL